MMPTRPAIPQCIISAQREGYLVDMQTLLRVDAFLSNWGAPHDVESDTCFCHPRIESFPEGRVIIHNAMPWERP